jgi:hypothetical protein
LSIARCAGRQAESESDFLSQVHIRFCPDVVVGGGGASVRDRTDNEIICVTGWNILCSFVLRPKSGYTCRDLKRGPARVKNVMPTATARGLGGTTVQDGFARKNSYNPAAYRDVCAFSSPAAPAS